jgi:uncharacterized protein YbjT (DUF2867 family)
MSSATEKKKILLVGASGLTGGQCLKELLRSERVGALELPLRSPTGIQDRKIILHPLLDAPPRLSALPELSYDAVICCLGTTLKKAGSKEAFRSVDLDLVVELGKFSEKTGSKAFSVVSSQGADPDSLSFYLRTKGEMEAAILGLRIPSIRVVRPALLIGPRKEFRFLEHWGSRLLRPFPGLCTPFENLSRFLVAHALDPEPGARIVENREILAFANRR